MKECDCGTKDEALVWCYIHGYKVKPPVVKRARASKRAKDLIWTNRTMPTAKNGISAPLESRA
jgi:hypothetical protein